MSQGAYERGVSLGRCSHCRGKRLYVSKKAAKRARKSVPNRGGRVSPYRCPLGTGWHLGHPQPGDRISTRGGEVA